MSKKSLKFLRNEVIEEATASRIRQFEAKAGVTVGFPIPIDKIVEHILGLDFDWDEIEEGPGEQILGGLHVANRKIYLNSKHIVLFEANPGLERSMIGHEAGHLSARHRSTWQRQSSRITQICTRPAMPRGSLSKAANEFKAGQKRLFEFP